MANDESDIGAFLSGFVIGGLVGAAVALILAPQSGEETRALMRQRGIELRERAAETAEEARTRAEKAAADARTRAEQMASEARSRAEHVASEARTRAEDLQHRGKAMMDEQRDKLGSAIEAGKKAIKRDEGGEAPATS